MSTKPFLFRYSPYDAIVAFCGLLHVTFLLWTFLAFPRLPWWAVALSFFVLTWAYCWNLQCVSHNFIHNPFFTNAWLNRAFGVLETLCIGTPHQLYHHYHLNHHAGDNDAKGPAFIAFLLLSALVVFFVGMMHLPRARFVLAGQRTNCVALAGSVTYLAGGETSRQFAVEFSGFFKEFDAGGLRMRRLSSAWIKH
jgi:fatty acid desaturase